MYEVPGDRLRQLSKAEEVCEWLVAMDEPGNADRQTVTLTKIIERAQAALPTAPNPTPED